MKTIRFKILFISIAGWVCISVFLLTALHAPILYYYICAFLILSGSLTLFFMIRRQSQLINLISSGLDIIKSGNYKYRMGIERPDVFGQISQSVDHMVEILEKNEKASHDLEMDNEVLVDRIRETHSIQERFQRLFENPNYGIFLCDFEGMIIDVNATGCNLLEYTKEELLHSSFYNLYAPEELTRSINATKIGDRQQAIRFESRMQTKNQKILDVEISSNIYDFKNEIIQNIVSDICQRKQMESELRHSEEKFRSFMESANDLMFITDTSETIVYANQAMIQALGMSLEILQTKQLSDLIYSESEETEDQSKNEDHDGAMRELIWKSKTTGKIYGELITSVILNDHNDPIGLRGVFRDVTERKKIAESRRLAQLGKLVADVAHEVKNRLMAILGIVEYILLEYNKDPEIKNDMLMIHEECRTMDDFVRQMLNFSRPSEGIYVETDIHAVLDSVLRLLSKSLRRDQIQLKKSYDKKAPNVKVDEKQMSEVFMNLIQNAQDAMEKGSALEIITSFKDGQVYVDIKDHGAGIPEEYLGKIFDPFFTTKDTGTGLGVSACYGIIHSHGGELTYTSEMGKGTTAHVILPASNS
ncbi:PAS domain S-box protein [bacterium]|nr:PAS domain S-box protein [bacterium]